VLQLQCDAVCCSCSMVQCVTIRGSLILQCGALQGYFHKSALQLPSDSVVCCIVIRCVAVCCCVLQCVARLVLQNSPVVN